MPVLNLEPAYLHLRCQRDALYFHPYGLTRDETEYVLSTVPIIQGHDEERHGHYRTRDLIVHYYNAYATGGLGCVGEGIAANHVGGKQEREAEQDGERPVVPY